MKKNSQEFQQLQRERIQRTKPWLKSSGPKTAEGKNRSKMNALKTSYELYTLFKEYKQLMKQQQDICNTINHAKVR